MKFPVQVMPWYRKAPWNWLTDHREHVGYFADGLILAVGVLTPWLLIAWVLWRMLWAT